MRTIVALAVLLAGLVALDRALARSSGSGETDALRTLLDDGERARVGANVAAVKLREPGSETPYLFARVGGEWRCMTLAGAPASTRAIQNVVDELFAARGLVLAEGDADTRPYALDPLESYEVSFHGTQVLTAADADTLLAVCTGRTGRASRPGNRSTTFASVVRDGGRDLGPILALDRDLEALLAPNPATGYPALLDPHVVPAAWSTRAEGPRRIRVERLGAAPYTLELEGERWFVAADGDETEPRECRHLLARGFTLFLARVPFAAVLPKSAAATSGFDSPRGLLTVTPVRGDELVLTLGDATPSGIAILNGETGNVFAIAAEIVPLLLPPEESLLDPTRGNPWDPYLR